MRILKVASAFFLIGFLAGTFERAAGLGQTERSRPHPDRRVAAAIVHGTAVVRGSFGPLLGALPNELLAAPSRLPAEVADGFVADLRSLRFGPKRMQNEPDRHPMSRMPHARAMSLPPGVPFDASPETAPRRQETPPGQAPEFIMPFERGRVTSLFHQGRYHPAIDLAGWLGTRVHATTRRQRVTFAGRRGGYGNTVITRDSSGRTHLYAHLQRITVRAGNVLDQGQMLGTLGSTGRSTGPHVHYEVRTRAGRHVDPVTLLFPGRRVGRGFAWNGARSVTRVAARAQPLPR